MIIQRTPHAAIATGSCSVRSQFRVFRHLKRTSSTFANPLPARTTFTATAHDQRSVTADWFTQVNSPSYSGVLPVPLIISAKPFAPPGSVWRTM